MTRPNDDIFNLSYQVRSLIDGWHKTEITDAEFRTEMVLVLKDFCGEGATAKDEEIRRLNELIYKMAEALCK